MLIHSYRHGDYHRFNISDPKPRIIHKAAVRDRLVHHAVHRLLYPYFDKRFISDSFSCRTGKGLHRALNRLRSVGYGVSRNHTRTCWVLKCDIRKFFASIDHGVLLGLISRRLGNSDILWLLENIISSFSAGPGAGLPLGNLTSQLFANIYMNEFDQFMKHKMGAGNYIRYADDFVILSERREWLEQSLSVIQEFLSDKLKLTMHPRKIILKTIGSGVDFLGWVHFPDHRVLRTTTKRRILRNLADNFSEERRQSYLALLKWGNSRKIAASLIKQA